MKMLVALVFVCLLPCLASAQAEGDPAVLEDPAAATTETRDDEGRGCSAVARQITHFEGQVELAKQRGNDAWEAASEDHLRRLKQRQLRQCPQDVPPGLGAQIAAALVTIGRLAATAATFGAF